MRDKRYPTDCSKCGEEFLRKPNESITCPKCREAIDERRSIKEKVA